MGCSQGSPAALATCEVAVDKSIGIDPAAVAKVADDAAKRVFPEVETVAVTVIMTDAVTVGGEPASVLAKVAHMQTKEERRRREFAEAFRTGLAPLGVKGTNIGVVVGGNIDGWGPHARLY